MRTPPRHPLAWLCLPALSVLAACTAVPTAPAATASLWGTEWRLERLGGQAVLEQPPATLAFPEAGRAAGSGSCNRFFGSVTVTQDRIGFSQVGSTRMACMGPVGEQENRYLAALMAAERFELQDRSLLIHAKGLEQPLRFVRTKP